MKNISAGIGKLWLMRHDRRRGQVPRTQQSPPGGQRVPAVFQRRASLQTRPTAESGQPCGHRAFRVFGLPGSLVILHLPTVGEFGIAHDTSTMRRGSAHPFKRLSGPSTCEHPLGDIGGVLKVRVFHLFECNKSIEVRTRLRDRLTAGDHGKGTWVECRVDIFAFPGRTARLFGAAAHRLRKCRVISDPGKSRGFVRTSWWS